MYLVLCNYIIKYYELGTVITAFLIISVIHLIYPSTLVIGDSEELTEFGLYIIFALISSQIYTYNSGECSTGCLFMLKRFVIEGFQRGKFHI